jgi:hypothetical protein
MKSIEIIAKCAASSHEVTHEPAEASVSLYDRLGLFVTILTLILCLTIWFATAAHAQDLPSHHDAQASATGWWSLESTASAASPHFLLSVTGLPNFQAFDSLKTSAALEGAIPAADQNDEYLANLTDASSLRSGSLLSTIQTSYVQWEANLADTETPTSVKGAMVYPLFQINYANGSLPVALYTSPLLGSNDTRW